MIEGCLWVLNLVPVDVTSYSESPPEVSNLRVLLLLAAAGFYGISRVTRFHPASNAGYAEWLKASPWAAGRPLPLGPVHPVWQDGIILGALTVLSVWRAHLPPLLVVGVFAISYLGSMTVILVFTRTWKAALYLGFLWPSLFLPGTSEMVRAGLWVAIAFVIYQGQRHCLQAFPWKGVKRLSGSVLNIEIQPAGLFRGMESIGWPTSVLSPKADTRAVSARTALSLSALFGWWTFCLFETLGLEAIPELALILAVTLAVTRLGIYWLGITTPFNIWGRIMHGRLLLPGFDQIFVTPCATLVVGAAGALAIRLSGHGAVATAVVVAGIWVVVFLGPPQLRKWALTGQHRFRPPPANSSNKALPRPI
jgi:hypothetical protein